MIYKLYEKSGKYKNMNLITASITTDDDNENQVILDRKTRLVLSSKFYIGSDYLKMFGRRTINNINFKKSDPVIEIQLVADNSLTNTLVLKKGEYDDFDEQDVVYPIMKKSTPKKYKYRLSAFYVKVKDQIKTKKESEYFKGIGYSLLCWILKQIDDKENTVITLEASGSGGQKKLVEFYTRLGFKTCADNSKVSDEWYETGVASAICMYSDLKTLKKLCGKSPVREFSYSIKTPFETMVTDP